MGGQCWAVPNYSYLVVFECVLVVQFYAQIHWSVVQDVELEGLIPDGVWALICIKCKHTQKMLNWAELDLHKKAKTFDMHLFCSGSPPMRIQEKTRQENKGESRLWDCKYPKVWQMHAASSSICKKPLYRQDWNYLQSKSEAAGGPLSCKFLAVETLLPFAIKLFCACAPQVMIA